VHGGPFLTGLTVSTWCRGWGGGGCDKAHRGGGWLVRAVQ
jgi:hypothetical protein